MTQGKERRRHRADPEHERRTEVAERAIRAYLVPSRYNALSLSETLTLLGDKFGAYTIGRIMRTLGISQDRTGRNGIRRFRIHDPKNPRLPGVWDNPRRLQAFIVGFAEADDDRKREEVIALLHEYNGLPYTPVIPIRPEKRIAALRQDAITAHANVQPIRRKKQKNGIPKIYRPYGAAPIAKMPEPPEPAESGTKTLKLRPHRSFSWKTGIAVNLAILLLGALMIWLASNDFENSAENARRETAITVPQFPPLAGFRTHRLAPYILDLTEDPELPPESPKPLSETHKDQSAFTVSYIFKEDDTLWGLVRRRLGSRAKKSRVWSIAKEVAAYNGIRVPEWGIKGGSIDSRRIPPGTIIHLPADL